MIRQKSTLLIKLLGGTTTPATSKKENNGRAFVTRLMPLGLEHMKLKLNSTDFLISQALIGCDLLCRHGRKSHHRKSHDKKSRGAPDTCDD